MKSWWKVGLIAYVLSLPILIWRSSRIGRAISIVFLVMALSFGLKTFSRWAVGVYIDVFTINHLLKVKQQILVLENELERVRSDIELLPQAIERRVHSSLVESQQQFVSRTNVLVSQLESLESAVTDLSEGERQRVKSRIIEIREKVKILSRSLDESEVRKQIEEIIPGITLLREDEKARFFSDLTEIGFALDGIKEKEGELWRETSRYQSNSGALLTSGTIVSWGD